MPANYVLLERTELNANAASVTFANIPQTGYTDLKIVASMRTTTATAGAWDNVNVTLNGTTTGYSQRLLFGNDTTTTAQSANNSTTSMNFFYAARNAATANTFSNCEIYIPNFTSANNKSVQLETAVENNSTTTWLLGMTAGLWSNTAAINSVTLTSANFFVQYSTFSLYGLAALGTTPAIAPKASGGNRIDNDGTYWYHTFTSSGAFVPQTNLTADAIVIGAGGAGGNDIGGGGGAGRVYGLTSLSMASGTNYICTIGAGGTYGTFPGGGLKGTDSSLIGGLLSYTSLGGGGGQGRSGGTAALNNGWSGGGQSYNADRPALAGNGGYAGGNTSGVASNPCYCGGGGGTTSAGTNSTNGGTSGGAGTSTYSSWASATSTGVSGAYAGGGGGANNGISGYISYGQAGGGSGSYNNAPTAGTANTGSGGGGGGSSQAGGAGGSGIVIIRYTIA